MTDEVQKKLSAARTRLILDKPFLGALTLQLPLTEAGGNWCKTTATDARNIYYNPRYIETLSISQTQFMLAHDALHCALSHFYRRQHRDKQRWDLACDFSVNQILFDEGLDGPPGALINSAFKGLTAEEIYPSIETNCEDQTLDDHVYDKNNESNANSNSSAQSKNQSGQPLSPSPLDKQHQKPAGLSPQQQEELHQQWQQRLAAAAQQAKMAGKLSAGLLRIVESNIQSRQSWRQLLAHQMSSIARNDYSYIRPSNRREGPAIFPSLRSQQINVVIAIDTSGSVNNDQLHEFIAEVNAIRGQARAHITLLACDDKLDPQCPWIYEPWEDFNLPTKFSGGGNTDFRPVFEFVAQKDIAPELLVYLTDGIGLFPKTEPAYQVMWLIKGNVHTPWGKRVQLN